MIATVLPGFLSPDDLAFLALLEPHASFEPGRQGTGYEKHAVSPNMFRRLRARCLRQLGADPDLPHDCYLLRYPTGSRIPLHRDDTFGGAEHHRINAVVRAPVLGGQLLLAGSPVLLEAGDAYTFRPDLIPHEVTSVLEGSRLVWTVGVLL